MTTFDLNTLHAFIIRAKAATYVGSGQKLLPYRLGSHDLQFSEGDWAYHDSYLGESDFEKLNLKCEEVGRILYGFQKSLRVSSYRLTHTA